MADQTKIEWTDATWNIITGCSLMSEGCRFCYAADLAATRLKNLPSRIGLAKKNAAGAAQFNGKVRFNEEWLDQPLRWKKPRRIFVCAHGDLFHENVPDEWIDKVFAVMALCPQHTFQVLTKRPERMRDYLREKRRESRIAAAQALLPCPCPTPGIWPHLPLKNIWLGTSIEDQPTADTRIPYLLQTPAAVRFVSAEPLLGPVDLEIAWHGETALGAECWGDCAWCANGFPPLFNCRRGLQSAADVEEGRSGLDWVIVGGESGRNARPMHPEWARTLRDQCAAAGVAFLFKQWGAWAPHVGAVDGWTIDDDPEMSRFDHREWDTAAGRWGEPFRPMWCDWDGLDETQIVSRIGKQLAGRVLDGVTHDGFPEGGG